MTRRRGGLNAHDTLETQAEIDACLECTLPYCQSSDPDCNLARVRMELKGQKRTYQRRPTLYPVY